MGRHTKGPWRVGRKGAVVANYPVPETGGSDEVNYYGGHLIAESIAPQNRHIIAAATDLLDAAKAALFVLRIVYAREPGTNESAAIAQLESAIDKAEGPSVFVVLGNDYPEAVFTTKRAAEDHCQIRRDQNVKEGIGSRIYWRVYEFPLCEGVTK